MRISIGSGRVVRSAILIALGGLALSQARGAVIAEWGFNSYSVGGAIASHAPEYGSQADSGAANLSIAVPTKGSLNSIAGTATGAYAGSAGATSGLQAENRTGNGGGATAFALTLLVSGTGLNNFEVTYATEASKPITQNWFYSLNGSAWTALSGGAVTAGSSWADATVDFSGVAALNGQATVYFQDQFTYSGNKDTVDFDNITVNAGSVSPVPEPTTRALPLFGLAFIGGTAGRSYFRRRQQV